MNGWSEEAQSKYEAWIYKIIFAPAQYSPYDASPEGQHRVEVFNDDRFRDPVIGLSKAFRCLNEIRFEWLIPLDENREVNGRYLRNTYKCSCPYEPTINEIFDLRKPASVLEVLTVLTLNIEQDLGRKLTHGDCEFVWFTMMCTNMGIYDVMYNDVNAYDEAEILRRVYSWMARSYNYNGSGGGIFVLDRPNPGQDLRTMQLWDQKSAWEVEFSNTYFADLRGSDFKLQQ